MLLFKKTLLLILKEIVRHLLLLYIEPTHSLKPVKLKEISTFEKDLRHRKKKKNRSIYKEAQESIGNYYA
jgi:hypothetical protein